MKILQAAIPHMFSLLLQSGPFAALMISLTPIVYFLAFQSFGLLGNRLFEAISFIIAVYAIGMGFLLLLKTKIRPAAKVAFIGFMIVGSVPIAFATIYAVLFEARTCIEGASDIYDILYFSYVAFTTVGFGDLSPVGLCRGVAAVEAVTGYLFLGLLVGASSQLFTMETVSGGVDLKEAL
jgi:hypothetical protein